MSTLGDAMKALKNIAIMDERVSRVQSDVDELGRNVSGLANMCHDLDKRLYALERIIDLGAQQTRQKRIEDQ
jgi:hypothetical protein